MSGKGRDRLGVTSGYVEPWVDVGRKYWVVGIVWKY